MGRLEPGAQWAGPSDNPWFIECTCGHVFDAHLFPEIGIRVWMCQDCVCRDFKPKDKA